MLFETKECTNPDIVKELFVEYSHIKGAESCFVSFAKLGSFQGPVDRTLLPGSILKSHHSESFLLL